MKQQDREQQQPSAKAILHEERQARGAARSPGKARGAPHDGHADPGGRR